MHKIKKGKKQTLQRNIEEDYIVTLKTKQKKKVKPQFV